MGTTSHFAYKAHTGGGAEEEIDTAGYGAYTVPQGNGQYLVAIRGSVATPSLASYLRLENDDWDGEDIYTVLGLDGGIDPNEMQYLDKPRFCPGGSVIHFYSLHGAVEDTYVVALFDDVDSADVDRAAYNGESYIKYIASTSNSVAKTITDMATHKLPASRGPFIITAAAFLSGTALAGQIEVPQAKNSCLPLIPAMRVPAAGVEGPALKKLLEPIYVPANETITLKGWAVGAAAGRFILEIVPMSRLDHEVNGNNTDTGARTISGVSVEIGAEVEARGRGGLNMGLFRR